MSLESWLFDRGAMEDMEQVLNTICRTCLSRNTSRFQWVEGYLFQYWTCWDCDNLFIVKPTPRRVLEGR
jgi:hypothetical protein